MVVSQLIKFAEPDSNFELVSVEETQGCTHVRFNLRRPMHFIDSPDEFTEIGDVTVTVHCTEVRKS